MNITNWIRDKVGKRAKVLALAWLFSGQILSACKTQEIDSESDTLNTENGARISAGYKWHIYDPKKDHMPVYLMDGKSTLDLPKAYGYKYTSGADSAAIAKLFATGILPSGQNIFWNLNNNWIKDLMDPVVFWTNNDITDEEIATYYKVWKELSSQNLSGMFTNIVYPRLLKHMKRLYKTNWYYPSWWVVMVNIPRKFFASGLKVVGTTIRIQLYMSSWQIGEVIVTFRIDNTDLKTAKANSKNADDALTNSMNILFHEYTHTQTLGEYSQDPTRNIDAQLHDNNLYYVITSDGKIMTAYSSFNYRWWAMTDWIPWPILKPWMSNIYIAVKWARDANGNYPITYKKVISVIRYWWKWIPLDSLSNRLKYKNNDIKSDIRNTYAIEPSRDSNSKGGRIASEGAKIISIQQVDCEMNNTDKVKTFWQIEKPKFSEEVFRKLTNKKFPN